MNTKDYNCSCHLATIFYSGARAQAFEHHLDTDVCIEKKDGESKEERLSHIGEIRIVDDNYLEGRTYTLTMEDKKKVFFFSILDDGIVRVDVNELAFLIAAFYKRYDLFNEYHSFTSLYLEGVRIDRKSVV